MYAHLPVWNLLELAILTPEYIMTDTQMADVYIYQHWGW